MSLAPRFLALSALILIVTGCNALAPKKDQPRQKLSVRDSDPAIASLAAAAQNIQKHWNDVGAIESAQYKKNHKSLTGYDTSLLPNLERMISLGDAWHGPLEPLVREVAGLTGYTPRVYGVKPAGDVIVNIDTHYRRAIDILADAGYQAGKRAIVRIKAKDLEIEIEYAKY